MLKHANRRRIVAWVALFAILAATFMPMVSHAFAMPGKTIPLGEICSIDQSGVKNPDADPEKSPSLDHEWNSAHCPFCLAHAGPWALPPSAVFLPIAQDMPVRPILFFHAPRPLFAWAAHPARAPPAVS